jgi:hypothetical protein
MTKAFFLRKIRYYVSKREEKSLILLQSFKIVLKKENK